MSQDGRYTAAPVFYTTIWNARVFLRCISAPAQSRKDDITAYMDGYAVGCRRVIIDRHCSVYRCHNFMSHSGKLAQQCNVDVGDWCALHGTSLSSDVLIPRVRTLALCWTRCPTIAYKYHGSLLWIIQLPTNITQTCRWIENRCCSRDWKYHLMCEIQKIWNSKDSDTLKAGCKVIQKNSRKVQMQKH